MIDFAARVAFPVTIRDLRHEDLEACSWSGPATHLRYISSALDRVRDGTVDYLAVCPPSGLPVAMGGVDYEVAPEFGNIWQLAVHPALQSCGLGSVLIEAAERRIVARGRHRAELAVADDNRRARALYERLGYRAYRRSTDAWDAQRPDGTVIRYETPCTLMGKNLR